MLKELKKPRGETPRQFQVGCGFCHQLLCDVEVMVRSVAQDHRPVYICSDCIRASFELLPKDTAPE